MSLFTLGAIERLADGVDGSFARPDHQGKVHGLSVIAVAALDSKKFVAAVKGIDDARRRLIRPTEE
jgi:hypothetical protein